MSPDMHSSLTLITPPVGEPLTVADVWTHLNWPADEDTEYIQGLITKVRQHFESHDDRKLITQTWRLTLDRFPADAIEIKLRPVQTIEWIKYDDVDGVEQTLSTASYTRHEHLEISYLIPAYNQYWPTSRCYPGSVRIQFVCGYGSGTPIDGSSFDDANYRLTELVPNWVTSLGITNKTTSGFRVRFNTAAPAGATFKYTAENGNPLNAVASAEVDITLNALEQDITFPSPLPTVSVIVGGLGGIQDVLHGLTVKVASMYNNREDEVIGAAISKFGAYERLIGANRRILV